MIKACGILPLVYFWNILHILHLCVKHSVSVIIAEELQWVNEWFLLEVWGAFVCYKRMCSYSRFFFLSWCAILPSKLSSGGVPVKKKSLTFGLCNDKLILIGNLPDSSVPSVIYAQLILFGNRNKWKQNSHRFEDKQEKKPSESSPQKTKLEIDPTF